MKLVKKLVSAVAAIAMISSAFVSMSVSADTTPTLTGTATVSEDKNSVTIKISYANANDKMQTAGFQMALDTTKFGCSELEEKAEWDLGAAVDEELATTDLTATRLGNLSSNYDDGKWKFAYMTTKTTAAATLPASVDNFLTVTLPILDKSVLTTGYEFAISMAALDVNYKQPSGTLTVVSPAIVADAGEPDTPVGPTIEETNVESDSNGRFAKGFGAKFTDVTAGGTVNVKWTLTNTETEATDSKTIAYDTTGISGNVAVGLVINMADTNVFENITAAAEIVE